MFRAKFIIIQLRLTLLHHYLITLKGPKRNDKAVKVKIY